jgi:hypothetical protein
MTLTWTFLMNTSADGCDDTSILQKGLGFGYAV